MLFVDIFDSLTKTIGRLPSAENVCQGEPSYWIGRIPRPYDVGLFAVSGCLVEKIMVAFRLLVK